MRRFYQREEGVEQLIEESSAAREWVRTYLDESAKLKYEVAGKCLDAILAAVDLITDSFRSGKKVMLCGNGGSAADCQHMAAEFVGVLSKDFDRPGLSAIALTTDTSFLTAYPNDVGFDSIFERQVTTHGSAGDVLIAISTSGNSINVIKAVRAANAAQIRTIGLIGEKGDLSALAEVAILVPHSDTQHIQEAHLAIEHIICQLVERQLFSR